MSAAVAFLLVRLALAAVLLAILVVILVELRRGLRPPSTDRLPLPQASLIPEGLPEGRPALNLAATNTIGRADGNSILLDHPSVSSYHARLSFGSGNWLLEDLGSRNGTRVNGIEVGEPMIVTYGDLLQFGSVGFHLRVAVASRARADAYHDTDDAEWTDHKTKGREA